jgi:propionyl-CoA carboxylase alpha chain
LQVEHPVTELITGVDLVEQQILIARGEPLQIKQEDLSITGHALELRVYAEDPAENFLPSVGTLSRYRRPKGDDIRLDDGYEEGMEIPIYYDPMIAKLVTYGVNRDAAIQRMIEAIEMYEIEGVETTLPFGKFVCEHEAFTSGKFDTHFVKHYFTPEALEKGNEGAAKVAAKLSAFLFERNKIQLNVPQLDHSEWQRR